MCKINVLVVGDSAWHNTKAIGAIEVICHQEKKVILSCDQVGTMSVSDINVGDYDVVAVDDTVFAMACIKTLVGADVPMVAFSDLTGDIGGVPRKDPKVVISPVIAYAITRGNLKDKIASVTKHIETTSRMLATA